jgi:protocatechuate 3,4-dioxygenase, beta subunit
MTTGRLLGIGPTDNTSDQRTPRRPLRLIPPSARESFAPVIPARTSLGPHETDLTRIAPDRPRAQGAAIEVTGRVLNEHGRPQRDVLVEIWNANTHGRYTHAEDRSDLPLDPHFLGVGRVRTDADGRYRFLTILPGAYLARPDIGRWRPRHIHLSLLGGPVRMVTQMYFPGDPHNATDPMAILMGDAFSRNIGQPHEATGDLSAGYGFDIVVGGRNALYFE